MNNRAILQLENYLTFWSVRGAAVTSPTVPAAALDGAVGHHGQWKEAKRTVSVRGYDVVVCVMVPL
jgi:hypothetical protein